MLTNRVYLGILKCGETESQIFPELQIIEPKLFERAQTLLEQRSKNYQDRTLPLSTKGKCLLSGNIFCGHCGARLILTTNVKNYKRRDGTVNSTKRIRYACYNKTRHSHLCDGQSGYLSSTVDEIVENIVLNFLQPIKGIPKNLLVDQNYRQKIKEIEVCLDQANAVLTEYHALLRDYDNEMNHVNSQYDDLVEWSNLYSTSSLEAKKMIVGQLIQAVRVSRDYEIQIDFNISYSQFVQQINLNATA